MELPKQILRPFIGARVLKTGIAVFVAVVTFHWIGSEYAAFAAVSAILAVQPSVTETGKLFREQLLGNLGAGLIAAALGLWLGSTPFSMSLGVVLVLGLLPRLGMGEAVNLAVVAVIFILDRPQLDFLRYTGARIGAVTGGMLIGYAVNRFIRPPNFYGKIRSELEETGAEVDAFIVHLIQSLAEPEYYAKHQIKAEAAHIHQRLESARHFLRLSHTPPGGEHQRLALEKITASMFVFIERVMDIHKVCLQAGGLGHTPERGAVAQALENVMLFRQDVTGACLAVRRPMDYSEKAFHESLTDLQHLIDKLLQEPDQRPMGLALYAILTNIRHMGWRMESLYRILESQSH